MSTTTTTFEPYTATTADKAAVAAAAPRKSFYQRFLDSRLRMGKAHASAVLARMSDTQLAELGFSPEQIREVRATGSVPLSFWG